LPSEHLQPTNAKFPKQERLQSKKLISLLFESGRSFSLFPFRIFFLLIEPVDNSSIKFLVSVPKKRFKKAVDRNLLKRRTRESFRGLKSQLIAHIPAGKTILVAYIYTSDQILPFNLIQNKLNISLLRLTKMISQG